MPEPAPADAAQPSWRHFTFFDTAPHADSGALPESLAEERVDLVTYVPPYAGDAAADTNARLFVALGDGRVLVLDAASYAMLGVWKAYGGPDAPGRVTAMQAATEAGMLVTVGEEPGSRFPLLRVWSLPAPADAGASSSDAVLRPPMLRAHARVQHGSKPAAATALEVHPALSLVAVGLADGKVLLLRDVADTLRSARAGDHGPLALRFKVVRDASNVESGDGGKPSPDTVVGLVLAAAPGPTASGRLRGGAGNGAGSSRRCLLIATVSKTLSYAVSGSGGVLNVLDETGCALGCAAGFVACHASPTHESADLAPQSATARAAGATPAHKLVLARDEAIYVLGPSGREASIALEGSKRSVHRLHGQLVIVSEPQAAPGERTLVPGADKAEERAPTQVTVFDLDTMCITYTAAFAGGVHTVWSSGDDWGAGLGAQPCADAQGRIAVLTEQAQLFELREKPLQVKLETLLRKDLFQLAVQFACASAVRFPGARLPSVPPSANMLPQRERARGAIAPLDALVADIYRRYGDTLYAKRDFEGAVAQFCKTIGVVSPSYVIRKFLDAQRLQFLASYLQALHVRGQANSDHRTLLLNCYTKLRDTAALDEFIRAPAGTSEGGAPGALPFDLETAIAVCRRGGFAEHAAYLAKTYAQHDEYLHIQLQDKHDAHAAIVYLEALPAHVARPYAQQHARTLLDAQPEAATNLLVRLYTHAEPRDADEAPAAYPSPESVFSQFVAHPQAFCRFLESLAQHRWGHEVRDEAGDDEEETPADADPDRSLVADTLLELYLTQARAPGKARYVLRHPAQFPYTEMQALMLCSTEAFAEGLLYLYERLGMVDEILQYWMDASLEPGAEEASARVMDVLARHGPEHPHLYVAVLQYLTSSRALLDRHKDAFQAVLEHIHEAGLLNALEVVQLVAQTGAVSVGTMSEYLQRTLRSEREEQYGVEKLIASYRSETAAKEAELRELSSSTTPRVFQNRRCDMCGGTLELPKVHFMCRHSFHLRCLGDDARECPQCARAHGVVQDVQRGNRVLADYDTFLGALHDADDGFEAVADMYAKGLLGE